MMFSLMIRRYLAAALVLLVMCVSALTAQAETPASYSGQLNLTVDGQDLSVKLCLDMDNQVFSIQGQALSQGQALVQLGLFLSETGIALQDSTLLDGTYGIDLSKLAQNLPGSVFAPNSGSVLALDQQLYDALLSQPQDTSLGIIGGADGPTTILAAGNLTAALIKAVSTRVAPGELVLETGTILTTETTITLDAMGMAKLASALLGQDSQKQLAKLEDALTQAGARLTLVIAQDRQTKALVSCAATWTYGSRTLDFQAVPVSGTYSLVRSGANGQTSTAALNVEEDTEDVFTLLFYQSQGTLVTSELRFRWDKKAGTYVFNVRRGDELDELTGTIQTGENSLVITADTANGEEISGCSLILHRDDPAQVPPFQDLLTMNEDEVLQLLHNAMASLQGLLDKIA